ncbi:unnamed protein product [Caenorhabditis brenneri]
MLPPALPSPSFLVILLFIMYPQDLGSEIRAKVEIIADTISILVSNLIDLVVRNEDDAEKLATRSQKNDEDQLIVEEVQLDEPSAQSAKAQINHRIFDETEFDMPARYAPALIPPYVELAPIRRRFAHRSDPPLTYIQNVWEMNKERKRVHSNHSQISLQFDKELLNIKNYWSMHK